MAIIILYNGREGMRIRRVKSLRSNTLKKLSKTNGRGNHSEKGSTSNMVILCKREKNAFVQSANKAKITKKCENLS
jgi:UDP-3-O-[3-hydroxymyristoyl] glucosamine N-acyltransferase